MGKNANQKKKVFKDFSLIIQATVLGDYADGPRYAMVNVHQDFLDRVSHLARLCEKNGLESVSDAIGPHWDNDEEFRLRYDSLIVNWDSFYFKASPKGAEFDVETSLVDIVALGEIATAGPASEPVNKTFRWSDGALFCSDNAEECGRLIIRVSEEIGEFQ